MIRDLLIEFHKPRVSLFVLSEIKIELQELLKVPVDLVHAPIQEGSLVRPTEVVEVYGQ